MVEEYTAQVRKQKLRYNQFSKLGLVLPHTLFPYILTLGFKDDMSNKKKN